MTIHLQLPAELELELNRQAERVGKEPQTIILDALQRQLAQSTRKKKDREAELLRIISFGFTEDFWIRHRLLTEKCDIGDMTDAEYRELGIMTSQIEAATAQRLEAAIELAAIRGKEPKELMRELGIYRDPFPPTVNFPT